MKQGKVWGETAEVYSDGATLSIHWLAISKGGYSSEHIHEHKRNVFFVLKGRLEVIQWPAGREIPDVTVLGPGDTTEVKPGIWHGFRAIETTDCIEVYSGRLIGADITRRTQGGRA